MQFSLPDFDTILEIHELVIDTFGGLAGVPHSELIEAALYRPQNYMHYDSQCDMHLVAAIMLDSIARYHSFADGNKRTALLTMLYTYRLNKVKLAFNLLTNLELEELVLAVANNKERIPIKDLRIRLKKIIDKHIDLS